MFLVKVKLKKILKGNYHLLGKFRHKKAGKLNVLQGKGADVFYFFINVTSSEEYLIT